MTRKAISLTRYFAVGLVALMLMAPQHARAVPQVQEVSWRDLSAWLVTDKSLPLITVEMSWKGGTSGEVKAGLTMLMARLMNEGAGDLDATRFQKAMADKAISLGFNAGHDNVTGTLRCLSAYRDTCFTLLRLALTAPRFDEEAITRMKREQATALRQAAQNPRAIAGNELAKLIYGTHDYARNKNGNLAALETMSRAEFIARHGEVFARDNLSLAIVGDMDRAQTRRFMRDIFASLPAHNTLPVRARAHISETAQTRHIERGGPQTTIVFAHGGIGYDHELFFPAFVMNSILGGSGFSSRLTEQVREARGLAYGVYSYWGVARHASVWRGSVASDNKTAQEALDVIRTEMALMAKDAVTAERLEAAKTYLTGAYALRFDSGRKIAGQLIGLQEMGRPLSYLKTRNQAIEAVSLADIKRAAGLLTPDALRVISVGGTAVTLAPVR